MLVSAVLYSVYLSTGIIIFLSAGLILKLCAVFLTRSLSKEHSVFLLLPPQLVSVNKNYLEEML